MKRKSTFTEWEWCVQHSKLSTAFWVSDVYSTLSSAKPSPLHWHSFLPKVRWWVHTACNDGSMNMVEREYNVTCGCIPTVECLPLLLSRGHLIHHTRALTVCSQPKHTDTWTLRIVYQRSQTWLYSIDSVSRLWRFHTLTSKLQSCTVTPHTPHCVISNTEVASSILGPNAGYQQCSRPVHSHPGA